MESNMELQVEHLCKSYRKKEALQDVSFTLRRGIYGLLGENGAGKSTLMRMMATVDFPTKGNIRYGGKDIFAMDEGYRSLIGYMPQDKHYNPALEWWLLICLVVFLLWVGFGLSFCLFFQFSDSI